MSGRILHKYKVWCETDNKWEFTDFIEESLGEPTKCPVDTGHVITLSKTKIAETINQGQKKTEDNRQVVSIMRFRDGFTVAQRGRGDDIVNGVHGAGPKLIMDKDNLTVEFQLLRHWYAIGGKALWVNCDLDDSMKAVLCAPATDHAVVNGGGIGNCDLIEVVPSSGLHIIIPASGNGGHDLDLTATLNANVDILKCVPVPSKDAITGDSDGWWDFDPILDVFAPNYTQTGEFDMYDFDIDLFAFGHSLFGRAAALDVCADVVYETNGVEGKILYSSWKLKLILDTNKTTVASKAGMEVVVAQDKNI